MSAEDSDSREDLQLRARIDRSLRLPLLCLFGSATGWLLVATVLGLVSALTLNLPSLFEVLPGVNYGRLQPAHLNALVYGWALQAAFGVAYWLMARLARTPLRRPGAVLAGVGIWNLTVGLGVLAVLLGQGTSVVWLDFPKAMWPVLLISYLLILGEMAGMFAIRRTREPFISQWYILAGVFWFPWIFATANGFIHAEGGAAVIKAAINGWYVSNLVYGVLAPISLAAAYYLASKTTGRPVFSLDLARFGFWTLVLFAGWTGAGRFMGGPLPAWIPSVSGAATLFLLIPCFLAATNLYKTLEGKMSWVSHSPALRFTLFAILALLVTVAMGALLAMIPTGKGLQFTFAHNAHELLALYGFFSMSMFGAIYFILPRVVGCEWPSGGLIRVHFLLSAYGLIAMVAFTFFAGMAQGHLQETWTQDFLLSVERSRPYLAAWVIGWALILLSNLAFLLQLALMFIRRGRKTGDGPTLIRKLPEDYFSDPVVAKEGVNA